MCSCIHSNDTNQDSNDGHTRTHTHTSGLFCEPYCSPVVAILSPFLIPSTKVNFWLEYLHVCLCELICKFVFVRDTGCVCVCVSLMLAGSLRGWCVLPKLKSTLETTNHGCLHPIATTKACLTYCCEHTHTHTHCPDAHHRVPSPPPSASAHLHNLGWIFISIHLCRWDHHPCVCVCVLSKQP